MANRYHATSLASKTPEAIASLLQESQGALYEIGVADDGTLVGLEESELAESLEVLETMAAKIGATVFVTRKHFVRTVEQEDVDRAMQKLTDHLLSKQRGKSKNNPYKRVKEKPLDADFKVDPAEAEKFHVPKLGAKLWVVEAMVKPNDGSSPRLTPAELVKPSPQTEELRISLTGPTTCGKSTLLGTLTTGELDNGRGKSRLSLLRHRHEMISGVTSSVAWEIFGYKPEAPVCDDSEDEGGFFGAVDPTPQGPMSRLVNYASGNISSWTDIHSAACGGRIVFMSDSAGHIKYRRTTIRSLVGWAPHYAVLLLAANDEEDGKPGLSEASREHMELCIKLGLRLIVVFTKIDVASKLGLRDVLSKTLTVLKENGRKPMVLKGRSVIPETVNAMAEKPETVVPIVFISAVRGDNISLVHELLMNLSIPKPAAMPEESLETAFHKVALQSTVPEVDADDDDTPVTTVFHVEEVYDLRPGASEKEDGGTVVSGHVRYGNVSIGDTLVVGPFYVGDGQPRSGTPTPNPTPTAGSYLSARNTGLLSRSPDSADETARSPSRHGHSRHRRDNFQEEHEWRTVKVISVRHLRLPVTTLLAGEAGTLGVVPVTAAAAASNGAHPVIGSPPLQAEPIDISPPEATADRKGVTFASPPTTVDDLHLRKGLVFLKPGSFKAYSSFSAVLDTQEAALQSLIVGSDVTVYIASVRAVARIVNVQRLEAPSAGGDVFGFDEDEEEAGDVRFSFEFVGVEWMELGAKVLVTKSGGAGTEVFVGRVVERGGV